MAGEGVAEDIAQVVPDVVAVQAVREDGLRGAGVQAVGRGGDLDRLSAGGCVHDELLAVDAVGGQSVWAVHCAANGPECDGVGALVDHLCAANCGGDLGEASGDGDDAELAVHFEGV